MKRVLITSVAACAAAFIHTGAYAQQVDAKWAQAEAKEHGCLNCHAIDAVKVGPSYKAVSAKYKGKSADDVVGTARKAAVHKAAFKKASDQDLKMIAQWILTL